MKLITYIYLYIHFIIYFNFYIKNEWKNYFLEECEKIKNSNEWPCFLSNSFSSLKIKKNQKLVVNEIHWNINC